MFGGQNKTESFWVLEYKVYNYARNSPDCLIDIAAVFGKMPLNKFFFKDLFGIVWVISKGSKLYHSFFFRLEYTWHQWKCMITPVQGMLWRACSNKMSTLKSTKTFQCWLWSYIVTFCHNWWDIKEFLAVIFYNVLSIEITVQRRCYNVSSAYLYNVYMYEFVYMQLMD